MMRNLEVQSHSVVLVDKVFNGQMPIGQFQIPFNKDRASFKDIAVSSYLTMLMRSVFGKKISFNEPIKDENAPKKIFNFENNVQFIYDIIPTKFAIKHINNSKDTKIVKSIFDSILELDEIKDQIFGVGINFDFFLPDLNNETIKKILGLVNFREDFSLKF